MNIHVYSKVIWHYLIMATLKLLPQITTELLVLLLISFRYTLPPFIMQLHRRSPITQCYSHFFNLNHRCVASRVRLCFFIYGR